MHIAIIFLAFYYLYAKYFQFSNNQNETSEDLHNTSTVPASCFQRINSNHSDVTINDSYQVILEQWFSTLFSPCTPLTVIHRKNPPLKNLVCKEHFYVGALRN